MCSAKTVFQKISQDSQENTHTGDSFLKNTLRNFIKKTSNVGVSLRVSRKSFKQLLNRTAALVWRMIPLSSWCKQQVRQCYILLLHSAFLCWSFVEMYFLLLFLISICILSLNIFLLQIISPTIFHYLNFISFNLFLRIRFSAVYYI